MRPRSCIISNRVTSSTQRARIKSEQHLQHTQVPRHCGKVCSCLSIFVTLVDISAMLYEQLQTLNVAFHTCPHQRRRPQPLSSRVDFTPSIQQYQQYLSVASPRGNVCSCVPIFRSFVDISASLNKQLQALNVALPCSVHHVGPAVSIGHVDFTPSITSCRACHTI